MNHLGAVYTPALVAPVLAQEGPAINSDGIVEWGVRTIIPILLLIIGIAIIASARKGRISENANTVTNVVIGCAVIAGAAFIYGFAGQITNLIFSS
jgi:hypothetical protein